MNVDEVLKVVEKINDSMTEIDGDYDYLLSCEIKSSYTIDVKFLGISLYNNQSDDRKYIDEIDDYEELELFLIRSMQTVLKNIKNYYKILPIIF